MRYEPVKMTDDVLQWGKSPNFCLKNCDRKLSRVKKRNQNSLWSWQLQNENLVFVYSLAEWLFYSRIDSLSYHSKTFE